MTVKAKSKKKVVKKKSRETKIGMPLEEQLERAEKRYFYAKAIKELQDQETQVAINRMVAYMARMAPPLVSDDPRRLEIMRSVQFFNQTYIAVRLLVMCAKWDIRIANFKLSKKTCADCGKPKRKP